MEEETYSFTTTVLAKDTDLKRQLKPSSLLLFAQEMSINHTKMLGFGREKTLDRGLLWVILKERFEIKRMPFYDETIKLITYPGEMLHFFFPRHFLILGCKDEVLVKGSALWALMDEKKREIVDPKEHGVIIPGHQKGDELPLLFSNRTPALDGFASLSASYSDCDLNGHLNNAAYLDLMMDLIPFDYLLNHQLKKIDLTFSKEIRFGETFDTDYGCQDDTYFFKSRNFLIRLGFDSIGH